MHLLDQSAALINILANGLMTEMIGVCPQRMKPEKSVLLLFQRCVDNIQLLSQPLDFPRALRFEMCGLGFLLLVSCRIVNEHTRYSCHAYQAQYKMLVDLRVVDRIFRRYLVQILIRYPHMLCRQGQDGRSRVGKSWLR